MPSARWRQSARGEIASILKLTALTRRRYKNAATKSAATPGNEQEETHERYPSCISANRHALGSLYRFISPARFADDAAKPLRIGILIPGSRADHGWMESAYNGMKAAEQRYGSKVVITSIENVKFADMEQALVTLASKNDMVIGAAGQTQASVLKVAKRFPKVKFSIVGPTGQPTDNVAQYDVLQARSDSLPAPSRR